MTRGIDATLLAEFSKPQGFHPIALIKSVWPDGTAYAHSGNGTLTWDSQTWIGISAIASFDVPPETGGIVPDEATLTIRGALDVILTYMDPAARGGEVEMWIGATTTPGGMTLIGEPFSAFRGYLDSNSMDNDPATGEYGLTVTAITGPGAREFAAVRHSDEDQKARHPGDTFFERAAVAAEWRSLPIQFPNPG